MIEIQKYINSKGLFDGRYRLLRQLSTAGGTADVWLAEDIETADQEENEDEIVDIKGSAVLVAVKIYRPKNFFDEDGIQTFKKEYKTVYDCHHANLLRPTGFSIIDSSIPYLIVPYCEKGSAEKMIGKLARTEDIWKFIYDTASGLAYLHSCNPPIIHQDIKPANILVDTNDNYCITDFGISVKTGKTKDECDSDEEGSGTIIYMPSERFKEGYEPIPQSDIWSLGATIYELITGYVPFGDEGGAAQSEKTKIPEIKAQIPLKIKKLIYACLNHNPDKRPTAAAIAEYARNKGRKQWILNASILAAFITVLLGFLIWKKAAPPADPFTLLCNSGDSIINIEKSNAKGASPIEYESSSKRLNEALDYYEKALCEEVDDELARDAVHRRITEIGKLTPLFSELAELDTQLKMAIEDKAHVTESELRSKKDSLSNIIKIKLLDL